MSTDNLSFILTVNRFKDSWWEHFELDRFSACLSDHFSAALYSRREGKVVFLWYWTYFDTDCSGAVDPLWPCTSLPLACVCGAAVLSGWDGGFPR